LIKIGAPAASTDAWRYAECVGYFADGRPPQVPIGSSMDRGFRPDEDVNACESKASLNKCTGVTGPSASAPRTHRQKNPRASNRGLGQTGA
jgi:hypothetical protein